MVANFTPCDASVTVSRSGQRVAVMRRRSSVISSCGKLALKGWMDDSDVVDMTFSTVLPDVRMRDDRSSGFRLQYPAVRVCGALLQVALAAMTLLSPNHRPETMQRRSPIFRAEAAMSDRETARWAVSPKSDQELCSGGGRLAVGFQEGQQVGIDCGRFRGRHAVREALVGF